jgi:hypothetical protein
MLTITSRRRVSDHVTRSSDFRQAWISKWIYLILNWWLCKFWVFLWRWLWRMPPSGMWRCVAPVRTDVSEERIASIIGVTRIGEIRTLAVASKRSTPGKEPTGTHWIGSWVGPSAGLEDAEKITDPTGTRTLTPPDIWTVVNLYTVYVTLACEF